MITEFRVIINHLRFHGDYMFLNFFLQSNERTQRIPKQRNITNHQGVAFSTTSSILHLSPSLCELKEPTVLESYYAQPFFTPRNDEYFCACISLKPHHIWSVNTILCYYLFEGSFRCHS